MKEWLLRANRFKLLQRRRADGDLKADGGNEDDEGKRGSPATTCAETFDSTRGSQEEKLGKTL